MSNVQKVIELTKQYDGRGKEYTAVFNKEHCDNPLYFRNEMAVLVYYRHGHWHARLFDKHSAEKVKRSARSLVYAVNGLLSGRREQYSYRKPKGKS
jgi:hypothetical protein